MSNTAKIAEFAACASDELATLANDNQPPEVGEKVHRLMRAVLGPPPWPPQINRRSDRPLNDTEMRAVRMLIDYQAGEFGVMSRLVTLAVEIAFEVDDLVALCEAQFDAVMRYLVYLYERGAP